MSSNMSKLLKYWLLLVSLSISNTDIFSDSKNTLDSTILPNFTFITNSTNFGRIINGYNCGKEQYAYLVLILYGNNDVICGGSLLTSTLVLTAGHCCEQIQPLEPLHSLSIRVGQKIMPSENYKQSSKIRNMFMHPDYSIKPLNCDICVVQLTDKIETNDEVKLTKLATKEEFEELIGSNTCDRSLVMGFGSQQPVGLDGSKRRMSSFNSQRNPHVQCANLKALDTEICKFFFKNIITDTSFCATDPSRKGSDSCQGDSGGPMFCNDTQIGIVSAGFGCGEPYPGIYSRVDIFEDFISDIIRRAPSSVDLNSCNILLLIVCFMVISS